MTTVRAYILRLVVRGALTPQIAPRYIAVDSSDQPNPPTSIDVAESDDIRFFEVGPRDGLQNEETVLGVDQKVEMIERLVETGVRDVEIGSFVHPKWVPQMADTDAVADRIGRRDGVRYWGLVPNERGLERALEAGVDHVATFVSASDAHNQKNRNAPTDESLRELESTYRTAVEEGCTLRGYVSTAFGCPYEGDVDFDRVLEIAARLFEHGADLISLGDTIGAGTPPEVERKCGRAVEEFGADRVALHLHDTQGLALTNAYAAHGAGVRMFDASVGGTGGCPYAPGAAGNVGSEDLIRLFSTMDVETGVDLDGMLETTGWLEETTDFPIRSDYYKYVRGRESRD